MPQHETTTAFVGSLGASFAMFSATSGSGDAGC